MAAHTQAKEYLLSYQNIIIFTVLFRAGDICFPLRHTGKCIFCLVIAVNHRDFVFYIMADSRVPQFTGIRRIFFGNVLLRGKRGKIEKARLQYGYSLKKFGDMGRSGRRHGYSLLTNTLSVRFVNPRSFPSCRGCGCTPGELNNPRPRLAVLTRWKLITT